MNAETPITVALAVGGAPFSGVSLPAGPATRAALRTWLIRCGLASRSVMGLPMDTLKDAYSHSGALAAMINKPIEDAVLAGNAAASSPYRPTRAPDVVPVFSEGDTPKVTDAEDEAETPRNLPAKVQATPDAQAKLAALAGALAEVVGMGGATVAPLDEARVIDLIKAHANAPIVHQVVVTRPDAPDVKIDNAHHMLAMVLRWIKRGTHTALVGPAGTGKTHLARQVAEALGRPFYFTGALDSPYKLSGFIDAQGRFVSTAFRKAYELGGVFLLDEVDASVPGVLLTLNAALANGHADFPDGIIQMHPDFVCLIAANTYGRGADRQYVGRNQLDGATLDRFAFLTLDYDEDLERRLTNNDAWHRRVVALRRAVRETKTRMIVSMRASLEGAKALADGDLQSDVENALIWKGIDADSRSKVEGAAR